MKSETDIEPKHQGETLTVPTIREGRRPDKKASRRDAQPHDLSCVQRGLGVLPPTSKMNAPPGGGAFIFGVMVPSRIACPFSLALLSHKLGCTFLLCYCCHAVRGKTKRPCPIFVNGEDLRKDQVVVKGYICGNVCLSVSQICGENTPMKYWKHIFLWSIENIFFCGNLWSVSNLDASTGRSNYIVRSVRMFCTHCGAKIHDEAVICVKCGCKVKTGETSLPIKTETDSTMSTIVKVFLIIGCISWGWMLVPLAWCIPITVKIFGCLKNKLPISTGIKVCTLLFVNLIAGICLLCMDDSL